MKDYRDAVIKEIISHAGIINAQEFFGARDQKPLETCLEELTKSQVFIMFLGPRYGTIDPLSKKSFVECEFDKATELKLPRFAYLMDEKHSFPVEYISKGEDAVKLDEFKERVKADLTVDFFRSPSDLAAKVFADLKRELPKSDFKLGKEDSEKELESSISLLSKFIALPKLFHGRTISITGKLGIYGRAEEHECKALSYSYGSAIKRSFQPVDTSINSVLSGKLNKVFAEGEQALKLIEIPADKEVSIIVRTVQGEYETKQPVYGFDYEPGVASTLFEISARNINGRRRVIIDHEIELTLVCALEYVEGP
ncbi:hypothetical protein A1355_19425 [Methylomonas koyamae]|uniref:DUF4062 domain-containing protein n=2 Tax=Methylococcaceae TaxID=403 RepID=A0A177P8P7_9GAMM|nr:hypothetical protein A1355_19425 [Methylomonas koyamae]